MVQAAQFADAFGSQLVAGNEVHLFSPFLFEGPDCRSLFWAQRTDHPHEKGDQLAVGEGEKKRKPIEGNGICITNWPPNTEGMRGLQLSGFQARVPAYNRNRGPCDVGEPPRVMTSEAFRLTIKVYEDSMANSQTAEAVVGTVLRY